MATESGSNSWSLWDYAPSALTALFGGSQTTEPQPTAPTPDPKRRPALLLLGDSITEGGTDAPSGGWITLLMHRYNRSVDIDCRGLSGYNTKWCVRYVNPVIKQELQTWLVPSLVTIWFGANDAALVTGDSARQNVPLDDYRANLQAIVAMFKENAPHAKIILITPPHVDDSRRVNAHGQHDRTNAAAGQYARACVEEAAKAGVASIDLWSYFNAMPEAQRNAFLSDGLHFNAAGGKVVDEQLRATIHSAYPDLVPRLEKWQLPDWHVFPDAEGAEVAD